MTQAVSAVSRLWLSLAMGVLYYAAAVWGLRWAQADGVGSIVWPAMGVAVAGAILAGWPAALAVIAATYLANQASDQPTWVELTIALGNGLATLLVAILLRRSSGSRWRGIDPALRRASDVLKLVLAGAILPALLSATIGMAAVVVANPARPWEMTYAGWFIGDAVGAIAVAPMLLSWWSDRRPLALRQWMLLLLCVATNLAVGWAALSEELLLVHRYLLFPPLIWAALAFRVRGASLVVFATSVLAVWDTTGDINDLADAGAGAVAMNVLGTQQFVGLSAVTVLLLAAIANERDRLQELRAAERALRGSEERLAVALGASGMGDWTWDLETDLVRLSPRAAEILEIPLQISITWEQLRRQIHDEDREMVQQVVEQSLAERSDYDIEYRVKRADGIGWVAARGHGLYDGARATGVVGVLQEVTDRRRAEEVLRRREAHYRFLSELAEATRDLAEPEEILAMVAGRLGQHLKVSRCAYADVEIDSNRFTIRQDYSDGCPSAVGEYRLSLFGPRATAELRGGRTLVIRDVEAELTAAEGARMFRSIGIRAIICCPLVKHGRLTAMMAVHQLEPRDWTEDEIRLMEAVVERSWAYIERARADLELRESEERLRAIAEATPECVKVVARDGSLLHMNSAGLEMVEAEDEMFVLGERVSDLVAPEHRAAWTTNHERVCAGERLSWQFEIIGLRGTRRWMETHAVPIAMPDGSNAQLAVTRDVTERKHHEHERESLLRSERTARAEAEQANAAKDQFLAVLSHELRTPLTPVLTLSQMLERQPGVPGPMREDLATIRRNIELEARLIDDLLDLTRISRGKLELHLGTVDLHEKVRHIVRMIEGDMAAKHIRLGLELWATETKVRADPARLQQVIWNILKNAVKFSIGGGSVVVRTLNLAADGDGQRIRLEVQDEGIGIEPHVLPRVFDAFEQGDRTITRRFGGLGLGLAISKALVDLHKGQLTAHSQGKDRGATFALELPCARVEPAAAASGTRGAGENGKSPGLRILLVEDHEDTARILARLLRSYGHEVRRAGSVAAALEVGRSGPFDVVLSDLGLPDGSGHEVIRALRARGRIRAVALSGFGMEEDIRKSQEAGFEEHLVKPVDLNRLAEVMGRIAQEEASRR